MRLDNGSEVASRSVPIDLKRGIPVSLQQQLLRAYEDFQSKADDPRATDEAKEYIRSMRLADPRESPEMYRLYAGNKRMLVLWGCERNGLKPLSPLDAIRRLPTFREAGCLLRALAILMGLALLLTALILLCLALPIGKDIGNLAWNLSGGRIGTAPPGDPAGAGNGGNDGAGTGENGGSGAGSGNAGGAGSGQNGGAGAGQRGGAAGETNITNTNEPPFLVVLPRAVVAGKPVQLIPRTEGDLILYGFDNDEKLHRKAHGVNDREKVTIYSAGVRKVTFVPANEKFGTEQIEFVVYEPPVITSLKVAIAFPKGLGEGGTVNWGEEDSTPLTPDNVGQVSHVYRRGGTYSIEIKPPPGRPWAAMTFSPVTVAAAVGSESPAP